MQRSLRAHLSIAAALTAVFPAARAAAQIVPQLFEDATSHIPATGSYTENIDFGDVDLDGDFDAVLADGGDFGNDQNRLYLNQGALQRGVVGNFTDETATRFPLISTDGATSSSPTSTTTATSTSTRATLRS